MASHHAVQNATIKVRPVRRYEVSCSCGWRQTHTSIRNARDDGRAHKQSQAHR